MADSTPDSPTSTAHWEKYWQGAGEVSSYTHQGQSHVALSGFWQDFFQPLVASDPKIIDIASGTGAVLESAFQAFNGRLPAFDCLDTSASAIATLTRRFPGVQGHVADAAAIPLESTSFDVATSQFGVEYAGLPAIVEMTRLLKSGGRLALVMHHAGGIIHEECSANRDAVNAFLETGFPARALDMFRSGFAACRGADQAPFQQAASRLMATFPQVESILDHYGKHVAGDTILRLYNDIAAIGDRIQHYDENEVLAWMENMHSELDAYAGRADSMSRAALSQSGFSGIVDGLLRQGFVVQRSEPLTIPTHTRPLAWVLLAVKP